ncbi:MAG TPA: glycosyltransferase [Desulfovibrio sp.]|uniref:glycosyltransferase family 2 protein n=1 Tax=Desulfovibrio sp. TaxID=885 RepID=UPI002A4B4B9C|nr:glycosyltransferase [Desulfovibrio sp.]MDY0308138.1 glycosyltransferase [Desulfovibrionaceae bacterium]HMM38683.1 glycosyltransferase [Desulfovibrio sp.]
MKCSVVIRCYNEGRHIGRLLEGILQQGLKDLEIVAVDSGSTDDTLAVLARYPVKVVRLEPGTFTFGRACNVGCRVARGEFVVFASAHTYPVYGDWLERLLAPFEDERVALVYGKQRGNGRTKYSEHQVFAKWFGDESQPRQTTPFCNNANAAVRRSVWESQPYDETLTGLEDIEWARRAQSVGHQVAYAAGAEVIHSHDETWAGIRNRYQREAVAYSRIFPQERFRFIDFLRLFLGNALNDCYHALHERRLFGNIWGVFGFRLMQFWGTYRGFSRRGELDEALKRRFFYPNGWSHRPRPEEARAREQRRVIYSDGVSHEI